MNSNSKLGSMRKRLPVLALSAVLALAALGGGCDCDDSTDPAPHNPAPGSTSFTGTMAGSNVSGSMTITVATDTPKQESAYGTLHEIEATGTLDVTGTGSIDLSGVYHTDEHHIIISGGGYTFTGTFANGVISGTFTGPGNSGSFTCSVDGSGTVKVYCGTFTSTTGGPGGNFNIVVDGTTITGIAVTTTGDQIPLSGTLTNGTEISVVNPANPSGPPLATGNLETVGDTVSGTYDDQKGDSGTWSGARCDD